MWEAFAAFGLGTNAVSGGAASTTPTNGFNVPASCQGGGGGTTVFNDTFESSLGWQTNPNGTDTATTGAWERGDPEATDSSGVKQLGTTVSGVNDLVTGRLAGSGGGGANDIDGGLTSIRSPAITLPATGNLTLSFSYYLAHGSNATSADFLRVSVVGSTHERGVPAARRGDRCRCRLGECQRESQRLCRPDRAIADRSHGCGDGQPRRSGHRRCEDHAAIAGPD